MELIIRNKWVSLGGSSYIKDINDKELFNVKGKIFSFTRKKFLYDMDGNLKYIIRNKFFRLFQRKAFILNEKGEEICLIRRKFFRFMIIIL